MSDSTNNPFDTKQNIERRRSSDFEAFGPNSGLVEEMYQQYLQNPSTVGEGWVEFFADYKPRATRDSRSELVSTPSAPQKPQVHTQPAFAPEVGTE